ncbi:hypothetical protein [Nonomuraea sp. NPDC002799]
MRRYRSGTIAALIAAGYVGVTLAAGVVTLVTGELGFVWWAVLREPPLQGLAVRWWILLSLVPVVVVQGWAYWQVLRGPLRGGPPHRDRRVTLLLWALYLSVAWCFLPYSVVPWTWWQSLLSLSVQVATAVLYFLVLRCARWLRLAVLIGGTLNGLTAFAGSMVYGLGALTWLLPVLDWVNLTWLAWMIPILAAQARDPRWSRTTVWLGALSVATAILPPSEIATALMPADEAQMLVWSLFSAVSVFGMLWLARSAHDLAGPLPAHAPAPRPARPPARWWPLPALAVVLPLLPAAVNLARGMPFWHGPRGEIDRFVREVGGDFAMVWLALDLLVGVGVPALLVLAAVLRRTRRLLRGTMTFLVITAAIGVLTTRGDGGSLGDDPSPYPGSLFVKDGEIFLTGGISPLWFSAALLTSALILLFLYAPAPAGRLRHHVLVTALATTVLVAFLPAADHARGPVTTAADCEPDFGSERPKPTPEQRFVCGIRKDTTFTYAATAPDQVLLAHGRRLCGVYTRNDPQELARLHAGENLRRDDLTHPLATICPGAAAVVQAAADAQERETQEWEADAQRMCDATPQHRPLIKAAKTTRVKKPQWTDYGVMEAYGEPEADYDPGDMELLDKAQRNGLVAARPGHLMVLSHSDFDVCVTMETYTRRPPVETKGWDHVVEVGYQQAGDSIVFEDQMGDQELPDLALDGYQGPYRIRVHYAWFPWQGEQEAAQRLLVMAFPGKGDKVVTYRGPARRR